MASRNLLLLLLLFFSSIVHCQVCSNLGQNPGTAFPVCGASVFTQTTVSRCVNREIPTPCPNIGAPFEDRNPYWYKFTCFSSGTLGFLITPNNLEDDYDWQLFDITGRAPEDIYTDKTLFVACNWSGELGKTGASLAGNSLELCAGGGVPLFSSMPELQQGHNYLLLVSHFTDTQSGYTLDFSGGSASITDTTPPRLGAAKALCDNKRISIKLNKRMKCGTLAANGSDFTLSDPTATISGAGSARCNEGFDMDSIIVTLSNPLAPGNYSIRIHNGTDANSLLDNCDAAIPEDDSLSFTISPAQPAAFDSITTPGCAPDQLTVVFSHPILCNSIAADGSDFTITGPGSVSVSGATTGCADNATTTAQLKLSAPIAREGKYTVILKKGTDGNTVINECSIETPEGGGVSFTTNDTVSALFSYTVSFDCKANKGTFNHNGGNGINNWYWQFGTDATTTVQNPVYIFPGFTSQKVTLHVSNGRCTDSSEVVFNFDNEIKADFIAPDMLCPEDAATLKIRVLEK